MNVRSIPLSSAPALAPVAGPTVGGRGGTTLAELLLARGVSAAPVSSTTEGIARALQAGIGGLSQSMERNRAEKAKQERLKTLADLLYPGGGQPESTPTRPTTLGEAAKQTGEFGPTVGNAAITTSGPIMPEQTEPNHNPLNDASVGDPRGRRLGDALAQRGPSDERRKAAILSGAIPEEMAMNMLIQQLSPETYGKLQEGVLPGGERVFFQTGDRGGMRTVPGVAPAADPLSGADLVKTLDEAGNPVFTPAGQAAGQQAYEKRTDPTTLQRNLVAAGLKPGTPAYQQAVLRAVNRPPTQINLGAQSAAGKTLADIIAVDEKYGPDSPEGQQIRQLSAKPEKPLTEGASKAAGFANRMVLASQTLGGLESEGHDPASLQQAIGSRVPGGNFIMTPAQQIYIQAQEDWVRAKLRQESGAVIGDQEMAKEITTYFPQPGDSAEVIAQKAQARHTAEQTMIGQSQGGFEKLFPDTAATTGGAPNAAAAQEQTQPNIATMDVVGLSEFVAGVGGEEKLTPDQRKAIEDRLTALGH